MSANNNNATLSYSLTILQQPKRCREILPGKTERRVLDPCPVVELHVFQPDGTEVEPDCLEGNYFMSITLFDESGTIELTTRQRTVPLLSSAMDTDTLAPCSESMERLLVGTLVDSVHKLRNMDSEYRAMCCFQDVRVKYPGTYRLRFSLMQLPSTEIEPSEPTTTLGHIFSDPFRVYSLKDFPGVDGSTLLTKWIAGQGVAIPLRNKGRLKQEDGSD